MPRILISDPIDEDARSHLEKLDLDLVDITEEKDRLKSEMVRSDAMIVRSATQVDKELLSAPGQLQLIVRAGVGLDNIDLAAAERSGVMVENTPEASSVAVAELAVGMMVACLRHLTRADRSMKDGRWEKSNLKGSEIYRKNVGIVGLGRIGAEVAVRTDAFGAKIFATKRDLSSMPDRVEPLDIQIVPLDKLLELSDIVSLHVPHNEHTHHLLNETSFARMKKQSILINCSRGGVVKEGALVDALDSGPLAAAAVDVFEEEPPPDDHPLYSKENVILSPHIGASTFESQKRVGEEVVRTIKNFFSL